MLRINKMYLYKIMKMGMRFHDQTSVNLFIIILGINLFDFKIPSFRK